MRALCCCIILFSFAFISEIFGQEDTPAKLFIHHMGFSDRMAVSRDGKSLVLAGWTLWDIPGRRKIASGKARGARGMSFSPDGKYFATGGNYSEFSVHDAKTGKLYWDLTFVGHGNSVLHHIEFTSDSKYMLSLCTNGMLRVWDLENKKPHALFCFHQHDSNSGLSGLREYLQAWRALAGDVPPDRVKIFGEFKESIQCVGKFSISPDDKWVALTTGTAKVWFLDWRTGKIGPTIETGQYKPNTIKFSNNGNILATCGDTPDTPEPGMNSSCTIELWDWATPKLIRTLKGHETSILHMAFSPDDKTLATGGATDGVFVWDVETGKKKYEFDQLGKNIRNAGVAILPDNKTLLTLPFQYLEGVHFYDLTTGKPIPQVAP